MKSPTKLRKTSAVILAIAIIFITTSVFAVPQGWEKQDVDMQINGTGKIKGIYHKPAEDVLTREKLKQAGQSPGRTVTYKDDQGDLKTTAEAQTDTTILALTIDSPPIDGFIPWITVTATSERLEELELDAEKRLALPSEYYMLPSDPTSDFVIGLLDSGASAHVMGYQPSQTLNITGEQLTDNPILISGVTGSVTAYVSQPLGIYVAGLDASEPNGCCIDLSTMVGQSNVAIASGEQPFGNNPDLPTAIGAPMAVFYSSCFYNDNEISVVKDGKVYTAPKIEIYDQDDSSVPQYPISIPLELRPLGGVSVSYTSYDLDDIMELEFPPTTPSIIIGNASQSLFFVHAVDMTDNGRTAFDKDRFMLDTGAQVTVIGSRIAARLGVDPANPEFLVEIQGVTGDISFEPGFYIDSLEIPALGQWLTFTNVPVVLLDIASPEGGTLDGIIGMNLFTEYNMVLQGGGLFLQDDPMLHLELIDTTLRSDVAPQTLDGKVDHIDLNAFAQSWLATPATPGWNPRCDIAPETLDNYVNLKDFAVLADEWSIGI